MHATIFAGLVLGIMIALGACDQALDTRHQSEAHNESSPARTRKYSLEAPLWTELDLKKQPDSNTVSKDGVRVSFTVVQGKPEIIDDIQYPGEKRAIAHVEYPGLPTTSIPLVQGIGGSWSDVQVGIGRLNRSDPAPTTLIQAYWGGAHCCFVIIAVVPAATKLQVVDFPAIDGEGLQDFPQDIDQDGFADFVFDDDRFKDRFSSHASSWAPPRILNIAKGQLVDVSARPSFASRFEQFAQTARTECANAARSDESDGNGVCAAYVAAAARLGRFDQAFKEATAWASKDPPSLSDCKTKLIDVHGWAECPDGQEVEFQNFATGLRWLLKKTGYIDRPNAVRDMPVSCFQIRSSDDASKAEYQMHGLYC